MVETKQFGEPVDDFPGEIVHVVQEEIEEIVQSKGGDGRRGERENELNDRVQFTRIADRFPRRLLIFLQFFAQADDRKDVEAGEVRQFHIVQHQVEETFDKHSFLFAMKLTRGRRRRRRRKSTGVARSIGVSSDLK